jgi:hypothetical protein
VLLRNELHFIQPILHVEVPQAPKRVHRDRVSVELHSTLHTMKADHITSLGSTYIYVGSYSCVEPRGPRVRVPGETFVLSPNGGKWKTTAARVI